MAVRCYRCSKFYAKIELVATYRALICDPCYYELRWTPGERMIVTERRYKPASKKALQQALCKYILHNLKKLVDSETAQELFALGLKNSADTLLDGMLTHHEALFAYCMEKELSFNEIMVCLEMIGNGNIGQKAEAK